jgi:hypothetical protein
MEKKKAFQPGEKVLSFSGEAGIVISEDMYAKLRNRLKEGRRPGHYFAPGCCQNPDYITQIPVLFEDGAYDVMRPMNLKKASNLPEAKTAMIKAILDDHG